MPTAGHTKRTSPSSGIQIDEHLGFQERMWRIERAGWAAIAAIIMAAAVGLFGHGLLSQATVELPDSDEAAGGMTLEYERFGRAHSESQVVLSRPARMPNRTFSVWLSSEYFKDVELIRMTPEPTRQELAADGVRYHFPVQDGPQTVVLRFKAERPGPLSASIRLNDGPLVTFHQWLFP